MKILILHNRYHQRGGEDAVFEAEYQLLQAHGHEVKVLEFHNYGFASTWGKIIGGVSSIFNLAALWRTRRMLKAFRPDLLHIHNLFSTATPSVIWAARWCGIPVVMTLHNFRLLCPSGTLLHEGLPYDKSLRSFFPWDAVRRRVYRGSMLQTLGLAVSITAHHLVGTWRQVAVFLVPSEFTREKFLSSRLDLPAGRYLILPNFTVGPDETVPLRRRDFLFVGRLSPEKGLPVLLAAFEGSNHRLVIVGDGPLRAQVDAAAARHPHWQVLGAQPATTVRRLMGESLALVLPSICYETFGMVAIEAFSVATPVIASRLGALADIVQHEINGLHVEAGNAVALRAALDRLAGDECLSKKLGQQARQTWADAYGPARHHDLLLAAYGQALRPGAPN
jgi:glycosyltransferase involved in cell wall biosynthesis